MFYFHVYVVLHFSKFDIDVVKTDNEPAMAYFICTNVYWRGNVHADVFVLWLVCHVGSLCVNKILTYLLYPKFQEKPHLDGAHLIREDPLSYVL